MSNENSGKYTADEVAAIREDLQAQANQTDPEILQEEMALDNAEALGIHQATVAGKEKAVEKLPEETKKILNNLAENLKKNPNLDSRQQKNVLDKVELSANQLLKSKAMPTEKMLNVVADKQIKNEQSKSQERHIGRDL